MFPSLGFDAGASSAFASLAFFGLLAVAFLFALRAVNTPLTAFAVAGGALAIRYDERPDRSRIQSDVHYRIDELFAEHGITIAFPQMDVHLDVTGAAPRRGAAGQRTKEGASD